MIKTLAAAERSEKVKFSIPRSVQQSIPIHHIYEGGVWQVGTRHSKSWRFADVNYAAASDEDRESIFRSYQSVLNALPTDAAAKITIFNRSDASENAELIRKATGCQAEAYSIADTTTLRQKLEEADLLVNATNVGMGNLQGQCLIPDASYLHHGLFVADIIYNPKKTALLAMAEQAGLPTANGLGMLLYQGAGAFRLWTGQDMPVDVVKRTAFPEL